MNRCKVQEPLLRILCLKLKSMSRFFCDGKAERELEWGTPQAGLEQNRSLGA